MSSNCLFCLTNSLAPFLIFTVTYDKEEQRKMKRENICLFCLKNDNYSIIKTAEDSFSVEMKSKMLANSEMPVCDSLTSEDVYCYCVV